MRYDDKRNIENQRVKKALSDALFTMMEIKQFSEITVTDLIRIAGVSRTSYYRNFSSLENVIQYWLEKMNSEMKEFILPLTRDDRNALLQKLTRGLGYYFEHRHEIILLYSNGFYRQIQENEDQLAVDLFGDMPSGSLERYNMYLISGAVSRVRMEWLMSPNPESVDSFARLNLKFIENNMNLFKI